MAVLRYAAMALSIRAALAAHASCDETCEIRYDSGHATMWAWVSMNTDYMVFPTASTQATATVIEVIKTISDVITTETTTEYGSGQMPRILPTNSDGTRVETITYSNGGQNLTTVLAYPTMLMNWPSYIKWDGQVAITQSGTPTCISGNGSTQTITTNPQFTDASPFANVSSDPRGTAAAFMWDSDALVMLDSAESLFPDNPVIGSGSCTAEGGGPNLGGFTQTGWVTTTSTSHVARDLGDSTALATTITNADKPTGTEASAVANTTSSASDTPATTGDPTESEHWTTTRLNQDTDQPSSTVDPSDVVSTTITEDVGNLVTITTIVTDDVPSEATSTTSPGSSDPKPVSTSSTGKSLTSGTPRPSNSQASGDVPKANFVAWSMGGIMIWAMMM